VQNGVTGYVDTSVSRLVGHMARLLGDPAEARQLGQGARRYAEQRFGIGRFVEDWNGALQKVVG
jgi:glycosyltransferase involved in cell wall biosynthesis